MAGEILTFQYVLVNQQPDAFFPVIHKPHDRHGSGFDVKERLHEFCLSKGQAGASNLLGQGGCLKLFLTGKEKKIKGSFLGIAQKQVFAHGGSQNFIHLSAGFNGGKGVVIYTLVGNIQGIQKVIGSQFLGKASGGIGGPPLLKSAVFFLPLI